MTRLRFVALSAALAALLALPGSVYATAPPEVLVIPPKPVFTEPQVPPAFLPLVIVVDFTYRTIACEIQPGAPTEAPPNPCLRTTR